MGADVLDAAGKSAYSVVYQPGTQTTAADTRNACLACIGAGAIMIVFCGGDGTARDVFNAAGMQVPILGIPAGVKMYSSVFTIDPSAAGGVMEKAGSLPARDAEILDVDEEEYRKGTLSTRLYGIARVPVLDDLVQQSKQVIEEREEERAKKEIARFMAEVLLADTTYILGAGTTTAGIAEQLGLDKTLLGVDIIRNGEIVRKDADEQALLAILDRDPDARIIVSPIGAQGFIFGRGTQQISAGVIRRVGVNNVIVVATPAKCSATPLLHTDTGDPALDAAFGETIQVVSGYRIAQRKKIGR
jgi:predicted polyphosphate/ATP-dependent NAD kinase